MKKSKFTEKQIVFALRLDDSGFSVADITRELGISEATFYRWKKQFGDLNVGGLRRLRQLEEEDRKLKQLVADLGLDRKMLRDVLARKV